jgi:allantoin racemase
LDLHSNLDATVQVLVDLSEKTLMEDEAHVLILGCTGLAGLASRVHANLAERGWDVPVLDPPSVAVKLAESLVDLGLAQSNRTYVYPPSKKVNWPVEGGML